MNPEPSSSSGGREKKSQAQIALERFRELKAAGALGTGPLTERQWEIALKRFKAAKGSDASGAPSPSPTE